MNTRRASTFSLGWQSVGNGHNAVNLVGHTVERHGHDGLGVLAGLGLAVFDSRLQQRGVHVPSVLLGTDEHGLGATIGDGGQD